MAAGVAGLTMDPTTGTSGLSSDASATPQMNSLLIVRLSAMGDIIHTLPAAAALRQAFPHATLGWLVEERWAELLSTLRYPRSGRRSPERPLVDRIHTVNTAEWRRSPLSFNTWQQMAVRLSDVRGMQYNAAIDFQGAVRSALLARWSGAAAVYGDAQPRENAATMFYTRKIVLNGAHVVEQALALAETVVSHGNAATGDASNAGAAARAQQSGVEFPVDPDAEKRIATLIGDGGDFVILNPGAGWGAKMWPAERYGQVAKELAKDGLQSLVNYGPREEELAAAVETASAGAARRISCSISELIALTRRARLFIGGDTGPMHLAAALKIPVVAIFGPTNPVRNGPFETRSIVLRSAISQTDHTRHQEPEQGLLEIKIEEVVSASRRLLRDRIADPRAAG
ncbi:MAG TPA: glycosyltransferase family 9 protein [Terriglobales bacterium]|nr:glycosyltransferase family 9 protein [Terriglobales bacterium]